MVKTKVQYLVGQKFSIQLTDKNRIRLGFEIGKEYFWQAKPWIVFFFEPPQHVYI